MTKFLVAMVADLNIPYSVYSTAINLMYAMKWGYDFHILTTPSPDKAPTWGKLEVVNQFISSTNSSNKSSYNYLFVIDADAYIQNHNIPLTNFTDGTEITETTSNIKDKTFLICENGPNGGELVNGGVFFVQINERTPALMDKWLQKGKDLDTYNNIWHEQSAINYLYSYDPEFRKEVQVFPYNAFNSWYLDYKNQDKTTSTQSTEQEQFIQHVMATSNEIKLKAISNFWNKIKPK